MTDRTATRPRPSPTLPDELHVDGATWRVTRAWPRSTTTVPFEVARPDGHRVAARWFADPAEATEALGRTPGAQRVDDRTVLHRGGADRRLPSLAGMVAAGAELVAHRPERRAVLRTGAGYRKLVRAGRVDELALRHLQLARAVGGAATVPEVVDVRDDGVDLTALAGRDLTRVGADPATSEAAFVAAWTAAGRVLRALERAAFDEVHDLPCHDASEEVAVTRRAVEIAVAADRLPARDIAPDLHTLTADAQRPSAIAHRDLHDGQVLVAEQAPGAPAGEAAAGLLDPDTLAIAEPALDLANLLAHLELRALQGRLAPERRRLAVDALLTGADPAPTTLARVPAHLRAAQLRLCAVHAWRPRWRPLAHRWWDRLTG